MKYFLYSLLIVLQVSCISESEDKTDKRTHDLEIELSSSSRSYDSLIKITTIIAKEKDSVIRLFDESLNKQKNIEKKLYQEKDSLIRLYNKSLSIDQTQNFKKIVYTDIIQDKYWKRGTYYVSKNKGEQLYNVRVSDLADKIRFHFMGINSTFKSDENPTATIYELDENKEIHVIDSFRLPFYEVDFASKDSPDIHLTAFMLRQTDNLIIQNDTLYYFKENADVSSEDSMYELINKRDYYSYKIGSKQKAERIKNKMKSNKLYFCRSTFRALINPQNTIIASTHNYNINFNYISDKNKILNELYKTESFTDFLDDLPKVDFNLSSFFGSIEEGVISEVNSDKEVFFGSMSWHKTDRKLYFDNSGFDYRCIWEADIDKNKVVKIVPEHEAIQPFFVDNKYIAYVESNKIMICESPDHID